MQPPVYHTVRVRFRIFARSEGDLSCHLNTLRVNDYEPLPPLNPCANCVSYPPVLHQIKLCAELQSTQGYLGRHSRWPSIQGRARPGIGSKATSCPKNLSPRSLTIFLTNEN